MCGIFGFYLKDTTSPSPFVTEALVEGLLSLQHRGQESAGISVLNPFSGKLFRNHRGSGLVRRVFSLDERDDGEAYKRIIGELQGIAGLGQTRYSTSGDERKRDSGEIPPIERAHPRGRKRFVTVYNGNMVNYPQARTELIANGYKLDTQVDTEVIVNILAKGIRLSEGKDPDSDVDLFDVVKYLSQKVEGAYNIISLFGDGKMLAFRDPNAFHPLVLCRGPDFYAVASEDVAFQNFRDIDCEEINPGEAVIIDSRGIEKRKFAEPKISRCVFEFPYFARPDSIIGGRNVGIVRKTLGRILAQRESLRDKLDDSYVVVPAPWTAVPIAEGFAKELGLDILIGMEKTDSIRGFINSQNFRERIMRRLYNSHRYEVEGRKVIIVDDSIVRAEASKEFVREVKYKGALEVHLRAAFPPIYHPCQYAIDFPNPKKLAMNRFDGDINRLTEYIGADSVYFLDIPGLVEGIGIDRSALCLACLNGQYPTPIAQKNFEEGIMSGRTG